MSPTKKLVGLAKLTLDEAGSSHWLELADLLKTCSTSTKEASDVLKQAWASSDRPDYRSKIARLAHPTNQANFHRAREADIGVNDLLKIARGNSIFDGSKVVSRSKDSRGGENEKTPQERLTLALTKALHQAKNSQIQRDVTRRIFLRVLAKSFDENGM